MPVIHYSTPTSQVAKEEPKADEEDVSETGSGKTDKPEPEPQTESVEKDGVRSGQDLYQLVGELKTLQQQLSQQLGDKTAADLATGKTSAEAFFIKPDKQADSSGEGVDRDYSRDEVQAALSLVEPALSTVADKK